MRLRAARIGGLALAAAVVFAAQARAQVTECGCDEDLKARFEKLLQDRLGETEDVRRNSGLQVRPALDPSGIAPVPSGEQEQDPSRHPFGSEVLRDPKGNEVARTTVLGLILIRDMYIARALMMADWFDAIREGGATDKRERAQGLYEASLELARLADAADAAAAARNAGPYASAPAPQTPQQKEAADRAKAAFDAAMDRAERQFPETNVTVDGVPLWRAFAASGGKDILGHTIVRNDPAARQDRIDLYNKYLEQGAAQLRDRANVARGHDTMDELWQYGSPELKAIRDAVRNAGKSVGSDLTSQLMDQVEGVRRAYDLDLAVRDGTAKLILIEVGLGALAFGYFVPVVALVCIGTDLILVTMEGNDLVIRYAEAEEAGQAGPILGWRHVLTTEERAQVQAGHFLQALVGAGLNLAAVRGLRVGEAAHCPKDAARVAQAEEAAGAARAGEAAGGGRAEGAVPGERGPPRAPDAPSGPRACPAEGGALEIVREGVLTAEEAAEIQRIADKYNTRIYVYGSRARGQGRRIGEAIPEGKGLNRRSDIDFVFDPAVNEASGGAMWEELQRVGGGAGQPHPDLDYLARFPDPPYIEFGPGDCPRWEHIPGQPPAPPPARVEAPRPPPGETPPPVETPAAGANEPPPPSPPAGDAPVPPVAGLERYPMPADAAQNWLDFGARLAPRDRRRFMELMQKAQTEGLTAEEVEWMRRTAAEAKRWALAEEEARARGLLDDAAPSEGGRMTALEDLPKPLLQDMLDLQSDLSQADRARLLELMEKGRLTDEEAGWLAKTLGEAHRRSLGRPPPYSEAVLPGEGPAIGRLTELDALPKPLVQDMLDLQSDLSRADRAKLLELMQKGRLTDEEVKWLAKTLGEAHERAYGRPAPYALGEPMGRVAQADGPPFDPRRDADPLPGAAGEPGAEPLDPRAVPAPVKRETPDPRAPETPMPPGSGAASAGGESNDRVAVLSNPLVYRIPPIDFHLYPVAAPTDDDRRDNVTGGNVTGGEAVGILQAQPRIADNESPRPQDRVFFNYDYYSNIQPNAVRSASLLPGLQDAGIELRSQSSGVSGRPAPGGGGAAGFADPVLYIEALGGSTGPVARVVVVNPGPEPLALDGFVAVEPVAVSPSQRSRVLEEVRRAPGAHQELTANFYCLELLEQAPPGGVVYRIAGAAKQERFAPVARALDRARRLYESGGLAVEGDPDTYFHSIRQWAAWTLEQSFDRDRFLDAFVEHAHKTFTRLGQTWSDAVAAEVRRHGERRWEDVQKTLDASGD